MKIKKFNESESEESYLDVLKKEKSQRDFESSMVPKRTSLIQNVTDAILKSEKTKDKLFLQELESLIKKHGY
ncbi:hypothetical protein EBU94_03685 [bacterium]|nr:hypothetical protein [bacterium]